MADIFGANYDILESNTSISGGTYYAVKAVGDSAEIKLTSASGNPDIQNWTLTAGDIIQCRSGFSAVEKVSGDGNLIAYKE